MAKKDEKAEEQLEETSTGATKTAEVSEPAESDVTATEAPIEAEDITSEPAENISAADFDEPKSTQSEVDLQNASQEYYAAEPVTVQPVKFGSFDEAGHTQGEINKNLEILMDIKLQLTVELGRTELPIKKVLELTRGSIIELEKVAGEPVELYANGKLVAHGEVVVIEDNFGLRITSITDPEDRIKGI